MSYVGPPERMMEKSNLRPVAFVLIAANHGTMLVNRHDYQLVGESGFGIGYQLLQTSSFEQPEVDLSLQLLQSRRQNYGDGVIALDCGANIGTHSVEWAKSMHDWGQVIAIEAQERIFYALAGNITINNCFNARAIWAAIGAANRLIGVPVPDYLSPSSFGSLEIRSKPSTEFIGQTVDYSETKLRQTQMMTIDALDLNRVDLIKMDIEGMELEGLAGAEETIRRTRPQLMIEKIKCDERALLDFCHRHGYRTFPFGFNLLAVHETDPASSKIQIK